MEEKSGIPFFGIQFNKKGRVVNPAEMTALSAFIQEERVTDLLVASHGWNNDVNDANRHYDRLLASVMARLDAGSGGGLTSRKLVVMGVFWPSKKFADKRLITGGAASLGDAVSDDELRDQLEGLKGGFDADDADEKIDRALELVSLLEDRQTAREEFSETLRGLLGDAADLDAELKAEVPEVFFTLPAAQLLDDLAKPGPLEMEAQAGGAVAVGEAGSAAGLGQIFGTVRGGALNFLNLLTYYQMKKRAGRIGAGAVNKELRLLEDENPQLKVHLVGHSFGARLVSAAARGKDLEQALSVNSMTLLQAAFSHNGFAVKFDGKRDGYFRRVVEEQSLTGPMLITHTANDRAVGIAYPLASRLAGQVAAALGDKDDPFGGLGRNGAQKTPEAIDRELLAPGSTYDLESGTIHNLKADAFISSHGDVTGEAVAHAILEAIAFT